MLVAAVQIAFPEMRGEPGRVKWLSVISDMAHLKLACALTLSNIHTDAAKCDLALALFTFKLVKWSNEDSIQVHSAFCLSWCTTVNLFFVYTDMAQCKIGSTDHLLVEKVI